VHDFLAVVDLAAERPHRKVGLIQAEGMRADRAEPAVVGPQDLKRDVE
jgi:hypothetical protein